MQKVIAKNLNSNLLQVDYEKTVSEILERPFPFFKYTNFFNLSYRSLDERLAKGINWEWSKDNLIENYKESPTMEALNKFVNEVVKSAKLEIREKKDKEEADKKAKEEDKIKQ